MMGRSNKNSKSVSCSSAVNLSQVKASLSGDSPSRVGSSGTQGHLQGRVSRQERQSGVGSHDYLPRGFEGLNQPPYMWSSYLSGIPLIKWKFPRRFMINSDWRVVAGEESWEIDTQRKRELRVLEAIYTRPTAIPPNPALLADDSIQNDQNTPLVPITPIEDEDSVPSSSTSAKVTHMAPEPDIAAAAKAAMSVLASNNIDGELLVKILGDPKMVEELLAKNNTVPSTMPTMHTVPPPPSMSTSSSASTHFRPSMSTRPKTICSMSQPASPLINTFDVGTTPRNSLPKTICAMSAPALPLFNTYYVGTTPRNSLDPITFPRPRNISSMSAPASPLFNTYHVGTTPRNSFDPITVPRPKTTFSMSAPASPLFNTYHVGTTPWNSFDPINVPRPMSAPALPFYSLSTVGPVAHVRPPVPDSIVSPSLTLPIPVINYYKSLVQQHGGQNQWNLPQVGMSQETLVQQHGLERRDTLLQFADQSNQQRGTGQELLNLTQSKQKKPCMYYNTARGCRNGANCLFQHSAQGVGGTSDVPSAKRVKLG